MTTRISSLNLFVLSILLATSTGIINKYNTGDFIFLTLIIGALSVFCFVAAVVKASVDYVDSEIKNAINSK